MVLRLSGRCLLVSGCSLRRKACRLVSRDESHVIDRRRAATGLARARARSVQSLGVGVPSAVAGAAQERGLTSIHN
jgi:acyl CoA:acetate/3-ketoacid CoA transferase